MRNIKLEDLAGQESQINIDFDFLENSTLVKNRRLWTYLASYPYFVDFFGKAKSISPSEFILGNALVYGLMPTTMNIRVDQIKELLPPLNSLKKDGKPLSKDELAKLKTTVNNSITGASKLLHFINPEIYPIWDSRINRFISGSTKDTNDISRYELYLLNFNEIKQNPHFQQLTDSLSDKLNYQVSKARAFELIMYLSDLFGLEQKPQTFKIWLNTKSPLKIPKYKRDSFIFISNLAEVTADPLNPMTLEREGYLLSEHYTNTDSIERALWVRGHRNLLISDNGNWTRMTRIADTFEEEGNHILNKAKDELANTGEITQATKNQRSALVGRITKACQQAKNELDIPAIIKTQLTIKPHYMIGMEDFTIPVLMMCGLLDETFKPKAKEILPFQIKTSELFSKQSNGDFGYFDELSKVAKFMVLHAYDYESALMGARQIKPTPKEGIAISYGAPMNSKRWITQLEFGNVVEEFGEKLPEPYLIAQAMTLGAVNGLKDDTPIHILGVGSPILIALTGYLLRNSKAVSIDSTAPFKDAFASKIYGKRHAFLKMNMFKVAAMALVNNKAYESKTPFFVEFEKKYPPNWDKLRSLLKITATTDVKDLAEKLEDNQEMVRAHIPFFTKMQGGDDPFFWDLRVARSGHNYWVLKEICESIRARKDDPQKLKDWTELQVERYKNMGSTKWAKAVENAYRLTEKYRS